jgi:hypothetical protein
MWAILTLCAASIAIIYAHMKKWLCTLPPPSQQPEEEAAKHEVRGTGVVRGGTLAEL